MDCVTRGQITSTACKVLLGSQSIFPYSTLDRKPGQVRPLRRRIIVNSEAASSPTRTCSTALIFIANACRGQLREGQSVYLLPTKSPHSNKAHSRPGKAQYPKKEEEKKPILSSGVVMC